MFTYLLVLYCFSLIALHLSEASSSTKNESSSNPMDDSLLPLEITNYSELLGIYEPFWKLYEKEVARATPYSLPFYLVLLVIQQIHRFTYAKSVGK